MAAGGRFQISAHQSTGRFYGSLPSGVGTVPGQQPPANDSLAIGTLVANPTTNNGAWPMADLVKMSEGWVDNGGTGNVAVDEQEHVVIDGTRQLQRQICYDFLQTFPRTGTYTVFKTGTAEIQILAGGVLSGWQSASSWTFTTSPGNAISLYVRSSDGTSQTLDGVSIVHADDVTAFQADSDALAAGWLSYIRDDMASPIVRNLLPHEVFEDEFARRTTPQSLSYVSVLDRSNFLNDENGSRHSTFSLEIQCKMVNQIGATTFYWSIPPHASNDWVLQAATLIQATLNPGIRVAIALTNESWNTLFWYNANVIRTWHIAKTVFTTVPGSNTWTATGHGFSNGDILASIVSPNSAKQAGSGPYHASGDAYPNPVLTRIQVTNATANTVDMVLQSDGTTPFTAPDGVTEVYAWIETAFDLDGASFDTQVDHAHGLRSSQIFDVAVPVFSAGGRDYVRLIESQSDFISRTVERCGPNGANGNYDAISLGLYYNAADVWEVGDTNSDMETDGIAAAEAVVQAAIVGHINAGFAAENIWSYEAGPHWLDVLGNNGTIEQRQAAFEAFASTQEMANTEAYFYGRCQELGLRNMVITSPDLYIFGSSGTWGSKSELYLPDIPRTTLYKSWKGYIEASVVTPVSSIKSFGFIHSLVYHDLHAVYSPGFETSTEYWMGEFANEAGLTYLNNAQFGQLEIQSLPPSAQLGTSNTPDAWTSGAFADQDFDTIIITPSNFTWATDSIAQHVTWATNVLNYVQAQEPTATVYIYEHWQEPASFPISEAGMVDYWNTTSGAYHTFFIDYYNALVAAFPSLTFKLIPVGPVIADMLNGVAQSGVDTSGLQPLNQNSALFEDDSPHGNPAMYFLAAAVMYRVFYQQDIPASYAPNGTILTSAIVNNYSAIRDYVRERTNHYDTALGGIVY